MTREANPYQPPTTRVVESTPAQTGELAGKGRRLGTFVIDYAGFFSCAVILGVVIALGFGEAGLVALEGVPDVLLGAALLVAYYIFFEGIWARTPGKMILGTVVVTESGAKPGLGQIVKRTLCRLIPFEPLSFLGETGWHDSISRTRVIRTR